MAAEDVAAWAQLAKAVFSTTYGAAFPPETLVRYLENAFSIQTLTETLAAPETKVLGAWLGDTLVGFSQLSLDEESVYELTHLYVAVEQQGTGLSHQLMRATLARTAGPVWLYVWAYNVRAIKFYTQWGFQPVGEVDLDFEGVVFHDLMLHYPGRNP